MKKNTVKSFVVLIAMIFSLTACSNYTVPAESPSENLNTNDNDKASQIISKEVQPKSIDKPAKGNELFCSVENEEEGAQIADLYGITMVEYTYKVAIFTTDEDIDKVISRGEENGWPPLEPNYTIEVY